MEVEKEVGSAGPVSAGIFRRLLAFVADIFIVDIFFTTPFRSMLTERIPDRSFAAVKSMTLDPVLLMIGMLIFLFFFIYAFILQFKLGQTVGQMLFGLRVISLENAPLTAWQVFIRNIFLIPVFPIFFLWIFDPLHLILKKTRLCEMMSRTQTVELGGRL
ncbi:RDD family protein [Candidatus Woesearchaeota archaeon]|nr:RDD family protein [Candidatus Woesearchaeota archaeon]